MKIGILTFHYSDNYGAVLQAFALKKYLESNGNSVEILNYNTSYLFMKNLDLRHKVVCKSWKAISILFGAYKRMRAFDSFRKKHLDISGDRIESKNALKKYINNNNFDYVIVGSDQVWNHDINGMDTAYFLDFKTNAQKISYAASFGKSNISKGLMRKYSRYLECFSAISVREKTAQTMLIPYLSQQVDIVPDPVFLLDKSIWNSLASDERLIKRNYILCYILSGDRVIEKRMLEVAKNYQKKYKAQIVFLGRKEYKRLINDGYDAYFTSPFQFLNLIKNAELVLTNSFHGTAFSVIFNKNFYSYVYTKTGVNLGSRIVDLLDYIGLSDRIVNDDKGVDLSEIEYAKIRNPLNDYIIHGKEFLESSIQRQE